MPAARYVQARQYASILRSSSLESRSDVAAVFVSAAVCCPLVIISAMRAPPLHEPRSNCLRSPCDHAFSMHHREPRDQAVGVVVAADSEQVVQTAVPHVSADEGLKPHPAFHRSDEITVEVSPARLSSPALGLAETKMNVRWNADETEHSRVDAEILFEHARAVREQRPLDRLARQPAAMWKLEGRE